MAASSQALSIAEGPQTKSECWMASALGKPWRALIADRHGNTKEAAEKRYCLQ